MVANHATKKHKVTKGRDLQTSVVFEFYCVDQEFAGALQGSQPLAFFHARPGFRMCVKEVLDHLVPGRIGDEALGLTTGELL